MALYTSAEANKLLRKLNEEKDYLENLERQSCLFTAATTEEKESVRPKYDYFKTQVDLDALNGKIRLVKHAINLFNATTEVPGFHMTIDQLLIHIPQLTAKKNKLNSMKNRLPKMRVGQRMNGSAIEYTYVNYDLDAVKKEFENTSVLLASAQMALDKINNSEKMEIDILLD